jgi:hypothetical protein
MARPMPVRPPVMAQTLPVSSGGKLILAYPICDLLVSYGTGYYILELFSNGNFKSRA